MCVCVCVCVLWCRDNQTQAQGQVGTEARKKVDEGEGERERVQETEVGAKERAFDHGPGLLWENEDPARKERAREGVGSGETKTGTSGEERRKKGVAEEAAQVRVHASVRWMMAG